MASKEPTLSEKVPNGWWIHYWQKEEGQKRRYKLDEETVPSVSTLLNQIAKEALMAAKDRSWEQGIDPRPIYEQASIEGTVAHDRAINALKDGTVPPEIDPKTQGIFDFWTEVGPTLLDAERMVGSIEHGYAGRFDLLCAFPKGIDLPKCKADPGTVGRLDIKTKAEWKRDKLGIPYGPWAENYVQLELYELAAQECGYPSSDFRAVLNVGPEGEWELYASPADVHDALILIELRHQRKSLSDRMKDFDGVAA